MDDQDYWDEESTWIALIDDDDIRDTNTDALIDRLGPVFAAQRQRGKDLVKQTFIPVVQHTKDIHDAIQTDIFQRRSQALSLLNDPSVVFERAAQRDLAIVQTAYTDAKARLQHASRFLLTSSSLVQNTLGALFNDLDLLLDQGDVLFQQFKLGMLEHGITYPSSAVSANETPCPSVQRLQRCADQLPVDAQRLTTALDKRAKHLGADDHAKAKENLLRGILEKY